MNTTEGEKSGRGAFLIVDDEEHIREILRFTLEPHARAVFACGSAEEALEVLREENIDVVLCDIRMPGMDGLAFLAQAKIEQPRLKFLMMTAHGTMDTVIAAMRSGASDFVNKPFENSAVRDLALKLVAEARAMEEAAWEPSRSSDLQGLIGASPAFLSCLEMARKAARSDSAVLILGESGTGKEVLARAIHDSGPRQAHPFIPVNCGAIPEALMESELFGHEKGAFTGAIASKPGKFQLADTGTLFLDEIGEMPANMQVKLLRTLQEKTVDPVGGTVKKVDFRLIAATHRDLPQMTKAGGFREDLYYRLNIIPIRLPALRERPEDISPLAEYFLQKSNERYGTQYRLSEAEVNVLRSHSWPGNIRELENCIERAVVLGENGNLAMALGPGSPAPAGVAAPPEMADKNATMREKRQVVERQAIVEALERNRWNKTKTAADLGISRRSLLYKVKEFGIE